MRILAGTQTAYANSADSNGHLASKSASKPVRLTLIKGQPVTIALKYSNGKRVSSRYPNSPDQMFYTLADGRVAYFPLEVATEIDALHLAVGEPFEICDYGQGRWSVERVAQAKGSQAPAPTSKVNGAGEDAPAIMRRCYHAAIDIALEAVQTAQSKGLLLSPSFEDVRAIAATLCITETGGRR